MLPRRDSALKVPPTSTPDLIDEGASSVGEDEGYDSTTTSLNELKSCSQGVSSTRPTSPSIMLSPNPLAGKETSKAKDGLLRRFGRFFFHSGVPSFILRTILLCLLLIGFGILGYLKFPDLSIGNVTLCFVSITLGFSILGCSLVLTAIHIFVVFCHQHRLFYKWDFIHYLSELEKYMAVIIGILAYLIALSFNQVQGFTDSYVFGSAEARYLFIKITIGVLIATALLAIKRHYMTGLAVSFNYSNYKDRIQESLFADRMLTMLQKAKHTFKFRQKWRLGSGSPEGTGHHHDHVPPQDILRSNRVAQTSPPSRAVEHSVRSVMDVFPSQNGLCGSPYIPSSPIKPSSPPPIDPPKTAPAPAQPVRSVASYLTESDKKHQFSDFFRLANQILARFSNVSDYRSEINYEARRLSAKLFKYLKQPGRDYLQGEDLLPYIEDEEEFRRAVGLIKRNAEGAYQATMMSMDDCCSYSFSAQDLLRAIDGILTEIYVTAKSLQTIETALDKVDFFFSILVGLIMIIIVAIVIGDAVKLLLALSTVLSGAAFAFGTSARNMFESMIFLLVIHPFDVGDRVFVPLGTTMASVSASVASMAGVDALDNLIVAEMHLLSTVFERWDGVKLYVPNYVLAGKPIFNIRRSGALFEIQRIHIDFTTSVSKIEELKRRMDEFVKREQSDYTDISRVFIDSMENCNRINLNLIYQHSTNWQDMDTQLGRRSKMLTFVKETLEQMEISYLPPVQRVAIVPGEKQKMLTAGEVRRLLELSKA